MTNEIKEILDKLKDKNNYISHSMILLSIKETTALLDYITNLQQERDKFKSRNEKAICYLASCDWNKKEFVDLYDILQGDDKE